MRKKKYYKKKSDPEKKIKRISSDREIAKQRLIATFHKYIRLRDCQLPCISCGQFNKLQAGHFYNAGNYASLRFDDKNVNGQCVACNHYSEGNKQGYAEGLKKKYGDNVLRELEIKKNNYCKLSVFEINILEQDYKRKTKLLPGYQEA